MSTPAEPHPWPAWLGAASVSAPFLAMGLAVLARAAGADETTLRAVAFGNFALVGLGLACGLAGVVGSIRADRRRWIFRAMVGTVMCGFAVLTGVGVLGTAGG